MIDTFLGNTKATTYGMWFIAGKQTIDCRSKMESMNFGFESISSSQSIRVLTPQNHTILIPT